MSYCVTFDAWKLGTFDIVLKMEDAGLCMHPGPCDEDCEKARKIDYIKEQLAGITIEQMVAALDNYGIEDAALKERKELEMYIIWLAAGDIIDGCAIEC